MITVKSVKVDRVKFDAIVRSAPQQASNLLDGMAFDGEAYAKRSFGTSPSSPGEPPGVDTGTLRASGHVEKPSKWERHIVFGTEYAGYLEFGTSDRAGEIRMAARPFMAPMAYYLEQNVERHWRTFIS